jgi:hypothetical protein
MRKVEVSVEAELPTEKEICEIYIAILEAKATHLVGPTKQSSNDSHPWQANETQVSS